MARTTSRRSRSARAGRSTTTRSNSASDAVALLKRDHRTVEKLFREFESADGSEQLAGHVCDLVTVHAQIEEEILYPAAREAFADDEEDSELVHEAAVEHATAKELIRKIQGMSEADEEFKATVKVLSEYIKHHVKEEEGELFPKLKKADVDLKEMGQQLSQRKMQLMRQMGLEEEQPGRRRAPTRMRASRPAHRGRSSVHVPARSVRH